MDTEDAEITKALSLWSRYRQVVMELLKGRYIRSFKDPKVDFSEWIVKTLLDGELAQNKSERGFDVIDSKKRRIQVKGIAKDPVNRNGYIVTQKDLRNNPSTGATHWAFLFYEDLIPKELYLVPDEFVKGFGVKQQIKLEKLRASTCAEKIDIRRCQDRAIPSQARR
ncbi:MAG: hypothetical protein Q6370_026200 [Candidatus Sigynarchaeota archaeon]